MTSTTIPDTNPEPQNPDICPNASETFLWDAANDGLELANLAAQILETGAEPPDVDPGVALLRDALRSACIDLDLLGAAMVHVSPEVAVRAVTRVEGQINFALALHAFLERHREPIGALRAMDSESDAATPGSRSRSDDATVSEGETALF